MNVAILGTGNIARHMAVALNGLKGKVCLYAAASRSIEKAKKFAEEWNFEKAYGSYEELAKDPKVDLVYIATPHSHHYENARLCIQQGRNVLLEKAFTVNRKQAEKLVSLAREKNVFLAEAIWTRYMPSRKMITDIITNGVIGTPRYIEAEFSMPIANVERLYNPVLAGGTLLDLGVYTLTFADMFFGNDIKTIESECEKYETGVDATDHIVLRYQDGKIADLKTSMISDEINIGKVVGTEGSLIVHDINNFSKIEVYSAEGELKQTHLPPKQINGYEYEVLACKKALEQGKKECGEMTWNDTLRIMTWMDFLRNQWGVIYPFEEME